MSDNKTFLTDQGHKKLKEELEHLKKVRRPEISERIKQAKDYGDLSENAEYADAREEQSFVEGRILELENAVKNSTVVSHRNSDPNIVNIGDTIIVERDGSKLTYMLVGSKEADPSSGKISNESPIGQAFLNKKIGDEVEVKTPRGVSRWKILEIKI
ncbi:transcription elongation factor GreA [bacterium CG10_46_32]|nr:MAG: transcription elongation factor GreA [bacterium CG10_46_32]PIR55963.1 MAG: transcription elongation factor GreA [Parcubacteria group bacterium CG10_big_fil_rev_8_21_14_0_10_46_32]